MVKLYGQLLQEMTARFALGGSNEGSSTLLTRIPRSKEEEQDFIKVGLRKKVKQAAISLTRFICRSKSMMCAFNQKRNSIS
jgi:hypothetical protein